MQIYYTCGASENQGNHKNSANGVFERKIIVSTEENVFGICDTIKNTGDRTEPVEILYHMNMGLEITYNAEELDGFVEWKMMGVRDYVLGLECGNCYPDGRNVMRENGMLKFLKPGETKEYRVKVTMLEI